MSCELNQGKIKMCDTLEKKVRNGASFKAIIDKDSNVKEIALCKGKKITIIEFCPYCGKKIFKGE